VHRQPPRRSSSRANAGKRERVEGFVGDAKHTIAQIVDVVAMHAVVTDCSIGEAIRAAGRGFLDYVQHEGCVRRAIKKLKLHGAVDALRAATLQDIATANASAMANTLPSLTPAPKKRVLKDATAPDWATLPGPQAGGDRYRVRAPSLPLRLSPYAR
jgi:hypothetical protein